MFVLAVILLGAMHSCAGEMKQETSIGLEPVEIKEYQGEKLGSLQDFRENSIKGPQDIDIVTYRLSLKGLVNKPALYTYHEAIDKFQHYTKLVTINCVEGWSVKILWEGLQLSYLFAEAEIKPEAKTVIFYAHDDYTTSLPLQYILDNNLLLAYKMNSVTIPSKNGVPFQLVAEDKWGYKWIKWVTEIELSDNMNYKGYWETRGYSNDAGLNKSFLDR
ncbi:MAG: molybdopterin-dependent oxidoreductase [Dehalococcoidia bacterium]|nr:molybdopterin-dependent oxidoreductase [Dehalococcoidia bacterium]